MKKISLLSIIIALCVNLTAQTDTIRLSVSQAIQYGLSARFDIKADSLNIGIAESNYSKSKKELIPDFSANGKVSYYNDVQPSIIPGGYLGFTEPHKIAMAMKNNTAFALDLNFPVFKPGLYTDIKIAGNNLAIAQEKHLKTSNDIRTEISESYYNVLLKRLQYAIATKNEQRYKAYYELATGKFSNGALIESDALQAELDYKNAQANAEKQKQNYILSEQYLKYKINLPRQSGIVLTDSLETIRDLPPLMDSLTGVGFRSNRPELKQLALEQDGYTLQLKKAWQNYLPTFSVFANYTQLFQGPKFDYSNHFYWAPVNYVGVKLSIPISVSIKNNNVVHESKFKITQAAFTLQQKTADVEYEIRQAITRLSDAEKNLSVAKNNYDLSERVYGLKQQQYGLGAFSYERLLDTEKSLHAAEQDYIITVYDYLIAKINYQKAMGNL